MSDARLLFEALALALLLSGCTGSDPVPAPAASDLGDATSASTGPTGPPAAASAPPAANETAPAQAAAPEPFAWASCSSWAGTLLHKHEWAAALVPAGYRQANAQAGNVGETLAWVASCDGTSVGNASYFPNAGFSVLAIRVEPPPAVAAPGANYYLLDLAATDAGLVAQMASAGLPATRASQAIGPSQVEVDGDSASFTMASLHGDATPESSALQARFHWVEGATACFVDSSRTLDKQETLELLFEGRSGPAETISGPAHALGGVGSLLLESGRFAGKACVEAAP